jgi:hypothetical protein
MTVRRPPIDPAEVPLPRYMRVHWNSNSGETSYRAEASTRMRNAGFPVPYMSFGTDLQTALALYDAVWAPVLKNWNENAASIPVVDQKVYGSLEWFLDEYRGTERYKALSEATKKDYVGRVRCISGLVMKNNRFGGQQIGKIPLKWITEAVVDDLYAQHVVMTEIDEQGNEVVMTEIDEHGNEVESRRERTAKGNFEACRAVINALKRKYKHLLPDKENPFCGVHMPYSVDSPLPIPDPFLGRFTRRSDEKGLDSVSAIALYAFEFEVRATHFPSRTDVSDFRGPNHEDEIFVRAEKVGKSAYFYLENDDGELLYPKLTERLTKLKGDRKTGPMFLCERADKTRVWRPRELRAVIKEICEEAGLPPLNLSQFRKGGLSESGRAGLTPGQITSQSLHDNWHILQKHYIDNNAESAMAGQEKRLEYRRKKARRGSTS